MATEAAFALAALRLRLDLASTLAVEAGRWAADPGLDEAAEAIASPFWRLRSRREPHGAFHLRAMIPEQQPTPALVAAAFRAVLGRAPDSGGMRHYTAMLESKTLGAVLEHLASSPEAARREEVFAFSREPPPG